MKGNAGAANVPRSPALSIFRMCERSGLIVAADAGEGRRAPTHLSSWQTAQPVRNSIFTLLRDDTAILAGLIDND
jgi:hypothetical protein